MLQDMVSPKTSSKHDSLPYCRTTNVILEVDQLDIGHVARVAYHEVSTTYMCIRTS